MVSNMLALGGAMGTTSSRKVFPLLALLAVSPALAACGASSKSDTGAAGSKPTSGGSGGSVAIGGAGGSAPRGCNSDVQFASPTVEAAVRQRLVQPAGPLNGSALMAITDLLIPASAGEVTALDGMQCLVSLRVLGVPPGPLESLAPLTDLSELVSIHFADNRVASLAPLGQKPKLRTISASSNAITNLSDLALAPQECGALELTANPLTSPATENELQRFCNDGWFVTWGQVGTPSSCNDDCLPRP
jgi:hypothetical protein